MDDCLPTTRWAVGAGRCHGRPGVHPRPELATSRAFGAVARTGRGGRPDPGSSFRALPSPTPEQSRGRVVSEVLEEGAVEIDAAVRRTVEGSGGRAGAPTG